MAVEKLVIVGSGPAGLTAAIYAARANLEPLVLEGYQAGGQLMITTDVENYPGFPEGVQGPEMMDLFRKQAKRFGARCLVEQVEEVDFCRRPFILKSDKGSYEARAVIVATGATAKRLGLPKEQELMGYGVSACATCDGFFFKEKELVVVGGGDSAMEEAVFLTKFASRVTVVHRRDKLRASKIMQERARKNPKIEFKWNRVVADILGSRDEGVKGVVLKGTDNGKMEEFPCQGMFLAIGHSPNTQIFQGQLDMSEQGYLKVEPGRTATSVKGVFAAGDVADARYRQAVTAAGTGCMAALDAEKYLEEEES